MHARKVVPFLLIAGAVMMIMHHRYERLGEGEAGEKRGPHGEWGKRVPPLFEKWHNAAHAAESQPATSAPAV